MGKIAHLQPAHVRDIPEALRNIANEIESGEEVTPDVLVLAGISYGKPPILYSLGRRSDDLSTISVLEVAKFMIMDGACSGQEE